MMKDEKRNQIIESSLSAHVKKGLTLTVDLLDFLELFVDALLILHLSKEREKVRIFFPGKIVCRKQEKKLQGKALLKVFRGVALR